MFNLARCYSQVIAQYQIAQHHEEQAKTHRIQHITALSKVGTLLIEMRDYLDEATQNNPIETDLGTFTSFADYLDNSGLSFSSRSAYHFIKLAENWHIVEILLRQTKDDVAVHKALRLSRLLQVIKWAQSKMQDGAPMSELSLELYWYENVRRSSSITEQQETVTYSQYQQVLLENQRLSALVAQLQADLQRVRQVVSV